VSKWDYGYSRHSAPFSPKIIEGRINPWKGKVNRGDIVVFKLPRDNKTDYIKRVIGLPGDRIQMRDNQLYINEEPVKEVVLSHTNLETPYGSQPATKLRETLPNGVVHTIQDFGPGNTLDTTGVYSVPEGYYFMMGDNRDNSIDSRVAPEYGVGFVPAENIVGHARIILFSWTPGAKLWKPWTWVTHLRPSRFFTPLK
jgi:signal peptidase I